MRMSDDRAEGILKASYQIAAVMTISYAAYKLIPLILDSAIAYWRLVIFFLIGVFLFTKLAETSTRALNGVIVHINRLSEARPLASVPVVGWLARKWDEKETREAAKRRP